MTLAEASTLRGLWLAAETAVASGQQYTIGTRTLIRADAGFIHKMFLYYDGLVTALTTGNGPGVRMQRAVFRDL